MDVDGAAWPAVGERDAVIAGLQRQYQYARPVCFQGFPDAMLPPELQEANPLGIRRLRDGKPE